MVLMHNSHILTTMYTDALHDKKKLKIFYYFSFCHKKFQVIFYIFHKHIIQIVSLLTPPPVTLRRRQIPLDVYTAHTYQSALCTPPTLAVIRQQLKLCATTKLAVAVIDGHNGKDSIVCCIDLGLSNSAMVFVGASSG